MYFADAYGQPTQPMQGVNVVARWIDPSTGLPSRAYVATAVSGSLFRGNAGNPVTGYEDGAGQSFDRFGSDDPNVEGFFDLAGLQIPDGTNSAQYQINVEALDPLWSVGVGPYGSLQVKPSGAAQTITLTINKGGDVQQDVLMLSSAIAKPDWFEPTPYASPASVPAGGEWSGTLSGYGNVDYFRFAGQANRTMSVEITALDETGATSQSKAQPVVGMWSLANPGSSPAPANTPSAFNTVNFGITRLDAALFQSTDFRIGISDIRGDGRPDFRYRARVFYGDSVAPTRASVGGRTVVSAQGFGFRANTAATVTSTSATMLASSGNRLLLSTPPLSDGVKDVTLRDPATGASSVLTGILTYGAGPNDTLLLIYGSNPSTPVGAAAPNPVVVQVLAPDDITPVIGASVFLTATPAVSFSACSGAANCTVLTDQSGIVSTRVTVLTAGTTTITAQLAPASYSPAQQVQATVFGVSSALAIILNAPNLWVAQGGTGRHARRSPRRASALQRRTRERGHGHIFLE